MAPQYSEVLSNPIILRLILQFLPQRDILTCLRVCRDFQYNILNSNDVRRVLFLAPLPSSNTSQKHERKRDEARTDEARQTYTINPLLSETFPFFFESAHDHQNRLWIFSAFDEQLHSRNLQQARASWRKMLVAEPPITKLEIIRAVVGQRGRSISRAYKTYEHGLIMDVLYDIVLTHLTGGFVRAFAVDWNRSSDRSGHVTSDNTGEQPFGNQVEMAEACVSLVLRKTMTCKRGRDNGAHAWFERWKSQDQGSDVLRNLDFEQVDSPGDRDRLSWTCRATYWRNNGQAP